MNQKEALSILKKGHNVFLTGPPGSGKTFLLNKYIEYLKQKKETVAVTASTGIAATHMNGITLHSWSGLGIRETIDDAEIKSLMKKKYLFKRIRAAKVLIIDEVSMLNAHQFDAVDKICQYFRANFLPFGGMQVVLSGDFFQLPPIKKYGQEVEFITKSSVWENMKIKICYLEEQFRHKDQKLTKLLEHIRENNIEDSSKILSEHKSSGKNALKDKCSLKFTTKLYTHNMDVDETNNSELGKINGKEFHYVMTYSGKEAIVAILKKSCLSPEKLVLKKGAWVMFIKNNFDAGYVNGTQGTVVDFDIMGMPIIETVDGQRIAVKKASWKLEEDERVIAEIMQIPLRLAWAITVHKSQGMTLDGAQINLSNAFEYGMGYVALSRVRTMDGIHLIGFNETALLVHPDILELDKELRQKSEETAKEICFDLPREASAEWGSDVEEVASPVIVPTKIKSYLVEEIRKTHQSAYKKWSEEEDAQLILGFRDGFVISELAIAHGRKEGGINSRLKKLGLIE